MTFKRMNRNEIRPDLVRELFDYNPDTGKFVWLDRDEKLSHSQKSALRFNSLFAGKEAFITPLNGYRSGNIFGTMMMAHRCAWAWVHGEWPNGQIDHINGVRSDNRLSNLRIVDNSENQKNAKLRSDNSSGCPGVMFDRNQKKWTAKIHERGKRIWLGSFEQLSDAINARKQAEVRNGYHPNHGRRV